MYKFIFILFLVSCSASHHIQKMQHHKTKAELKGAKFEDSIQYKYTFITDTITDTLTQQKYIRTTVVDSVPYIVNKLVYVPMSRQERKAYKDSLKTERTKIRQDTKVKRKEIKKETKKERKKVFNWYLISVILDVVLIMIIFRKFNS